jgi:hypothetical protein
MVSIIYYHACLAVFLARVLRFACVFFLSIIINYYFAIFSLSGRKPHATKVIFLEKIMILFVNLL